MIVLKNVSYRYPDGSLGVEQIHLKIDSGEQVAVLGAPGSGKTTLLKLMAGCLCPQRGTVRIDGIRLTRASRQILFKKLAPVWQIPTRFRKGTVKEFLISFMASREFSPQEILPLTEYAVKVMKLSQLEHIPVNQLTVGQQHAVELAAALAAQPEHLILDDPAALLPVDICRGLACCLEVLPCTQIIVPGRLDEILPGCTKVVLMKKGRILAQGDPQKLLWDLPLLIKAGLELPVSFQKKGIY